MSELEPQEELDRVLGGGYRLYDDPRIHLPPETEESQHVQNYFGVDQPPGLQHGGSGAQRQEAGNIRPDPLEALCRPLTLRSRLKPPTLLQQPHMPPQQQHHLVVQSQGSQHHVVRPLAIVFESADDSKKPEGSRKRYPLPAPNPQPPPAPPHPPSSSSSLGLEFDASKRKHSPSRSASQHPSPKHTVPAPGGPAPSPSTSPSKSYPPPTSTAAPIPILGPSLDATHHSLSGPNLDPTYHASLVPSLDATHHRVLAPNQGSVTAAELPYHAAPYPSCTPVPQPARCPYCQGFVPQPPPPILQHSHSTQICNNARHTTPAAAQHPQTWCGNPAAATAAATAAGTYQRPWQQQQQQQQQHLHEPPCQPMPSTCQAPLSQAALQQPDVRVPGGPGKEVSSLLLKEELSIHPKAPLPLNHEGQLLNGQRPRQQQQCCCAAPAALRQPRKQWSSIPHPQLESLYLPVQQQQQQQQWQAPSFRQQVQQPPHQQGQEGESSSAVDQDDSDVDGLPGRCQDGSAEGGRSALLQFLHHKMTQLRHHRLLRSMFVAWKQTASAKKIDRLLLETVDRLHAERVLQGAFTSWRALAQGGMRSPEALSPARGSFNSTPSEVRTPCSSTSSSEPARPARPAHLSPLPLISPLPQFLSPTLGPAVPGRAESAGATAAAAGAQDPQEVQQEDSGAQASPTSSVSFRPFVGNGQGRGHQHSTPCLQQRPARDGDGGCQHNTPCSHPPSRDGDGEHQHSTLYSQHSTRNGGDGSRAAFDKMRRMLLRMEAMLRQPEGPGSENAHQPLSSSDAIGQNGAPFHPSSWPLPQLTDHSPCKGIPHSTTSQVSAILRSPGGTVLNGGRTTGLGKQEAGGLGIAELVTGPRSWSPPEDAAFLKRPSVRAPHAAHHHLLLQQDAAGLSLKGPSAKAPPAGHHHLLVQQDAAELPLKGLSAKAPHAAHHHQLVQQDAADLQSRIALLLQGRQAGEGRSPAHPPNTVEGGLVAACPPSSTARPPSLAACATSLAAPSDKASLYGPLADIPAMRAQLQGMLHHLARVEAEIEKRQRPSSYELPQSSAAQAPSIWVPTFHYTSGMPIASKPKWRTAELGGTQDPESLLQLELAELEQRLQLIRTKQNDYTH